MSHSDYFKEVLRDYKVAAFMGSSRYTIRRMIEEMPENTRVVVEYGAGEGVITRKILEQLSPEGKLWAIEFNPYLASLLEEIQDSRLVILRDNVFEIAPHLREHVGRPVDFIVSGIPFSPWAGADHAQRDETVRATHDALGPGGRLVAYQFTPLLMCAIKKHFPRTWWRFEPRNFLPYFIMVGEKENTL